MSEDNNELKSTLIGMLFIMFEAKNDVVPIVYMESPFEIRSESISVVPEYFKLNTKTNIDSTKGINSYGNLLKELKIGFRFFFLIKFIINTDKNSEQANIADTRYISKE